MSLRTSREGFEGLGLQAKPRPAVCRRIPRSPPAILKMPAAKRAFCFQAEPAMSLRTSHEGFELKRSGVSRKTHKNMYLHPCTFSNQPLVDTRSSNATFLQMI